MTSFHVPMLIPARFGRGFRYSVPARAGRGVRRGARELSGLESVSGDPAKRSSSTSGQKDWKRAVEALYEKRTCGHAGHGPQASRADKRACIAKMSTASAGGFAVEAFALLAHAATPSRSISDRIGNTW